MYTLYPQFTTSDRIIINMNGTTKSRRPGENLPVLHHCRTCALNTKWGSGRAVRGKNRQGDPVILSKDGS